MLKLSIIGCGNVAKTIAHLWLQTGNVEIVDVLNRSQPNAQTSVEFIGAGNPLSNFDSLQKADIFMIGCGDDQIESCLTKLLAQNIIDKGNIVFHFSGAKSSAVLEEASAAGAICASLHPIKSFANPSDAINTFTDTYCGLEGNAEACDVLSTLIENIGGSCFTVDSTKKLTYHAASVFACNYLVALQELSIKAFEHSGVERDLAIKILAPIVKETSSNIFKLGTAESLTGPIARGDHNLVAKQYQAVADWDKDAADIYRLLGKLSVALSDQKGVSNKDNLNSIKELFK